MSILRGAYQNEIYVVFTSHFKKYIVKESIKRTEIMLLNTSDLTYVS